MKNKCALPRIILAMLCQLWGFSGVAPEYQPQISQVILNTDWHPYLFQKFEF